MRLIGAGSGGEMERPAMNDSTAQTITIVCDESGFAIAERDKTLVRVAWSEIREVFAYKEDLFSYDVICLGFRVSEDGTFWKVSEEVVGYKELIAVLPHRFPGIRTDWFAEVALPAFALNRTTLWRRIGKCC